MSPEDPRHGRYSGGRIHREDGEPLCEPCRAAEARYQKMRLLDSMAGRERAVSPVGTQRRLRALTAIGHSLTSIADHLGVSFQAVSELATGELAYTRRETAERIASLYDEWSMRLPEPSTWQERKSVTYVRNLARKRGWAPPLAWDDIDNDPEPPTALYSEPGVDPVVVMRLLEGVRVKANKAEKEAAMTQWVADGGSRAELARIHGWKAERYTAHLRVVQEVAS